ncbi:MAG: tetratricopeptide repeat protein [Chloroflexi bacterium]|nr:tetratricopeptide repeat protein [Chloroflexota bacterium]
MTMLTRALGLEPGEQARLQEAALRETGKAPPAELTEATWTVLPVPPTPLIGRDDEVAEACALLDPAGASDVRLLTLFGPGGVGKTRVALAVADRLVRLYADGAVFVDLASLQEAPLVAATVARALALQESGSRSTAELVLEHLAERQLLLVLDNFEQVLDAAPLLATLVQQCPRLALLVTSRTVLRLRAERRFPIAPLATPAEELPTLEAAAAAPAVRMFVDRAQAVTPDFVLDPSNARTVAAVCRRLDGMPLAIELAAARLSVLPLAALLDRLERRLPLLQRGPTDLPARQQVLRATLAWSHDLLAAAPQLLFRRLAVFAGGFTVEAAEDVCTDRQLPPPALLDQLGALIGHSLVRRLNPAEDEPRFGMLDTIREYATEQLQAAGEATQLHARHVAWSLRYAEATESELRGPRQQQVLAQLELEHDNLRPALGWSLADAETALRLAGALARFWSVRGFITEGSAWLERAVEAAGTLDPAAPSHRHQTALAKALLGRGWLRAAHGQFDQATQDYEAALARYRQLGDHPGMADALLAMGHVAEYRGDSLRARSLLTESIEQARAGGDHNQVGEALCWLARSLCRSGELAEARRALDESTQLLQRTGDVARLAGALYVQGTMAAEQGETAASSILARCRELYRQAGDRVGETRVIAWLGYVALYRGDYPAARAYLLECIDRGRQDELNELARWLSQQGELDLAEGRIAAARAHALESLVRYQQMGCPASAAGALELASALLVVSQRDDDLALAARLYDAAQTARRASGRCLPPAERALHERETGGLLGQHEAIPGGEPATALSFDSAIAAARAALGGDL